MAADFPFREQEEQRPSGARYEFFQTIAGSPEDPEADYPVEGDPDADPSTQPTKYYAQMLQNVTFTDVIGVGGLTYDTTGKKRVIFNLQADAYIEENSVVLCFLKNGKWFTIDKVPADPIDDWYLSGNEAADGFKIRRRRTDGTTVWSIDPVESITSNYRIASSSYGQAPYLFATATVGPGVENVFRISAETGETELSWIGPRQPLAIVCEKSAQHEITLFNDATSFAEDNLYRYRYDGTLEWSVKILEYNGTPYQGAVQGMALLTGGDIVLIARLLHGTGLFRVDYLIRIDRNTGAELWRVPTAGASVGVPAFVTIQMIDRSDNIYARFTQGVSNFTYVYNDSGTLLGAPFGSTGAASMAIDNEGHLIRSSGATLKRWDISNPLAPVELWSTTRGNVALMVVTKLRKIVLATSVATADEYIYDLDGNLLDTFNAHGTFITNVDPVAGLRTFDS